MAWNHGLTGYIRHKCRCDACRIRYSEWKRDYYQRHREHVLRQTREWAKRNPEKVRTIKQRWAEKNREKEKERFRQYRQSGRGREAQRAYIRRHPDEMRERLRAWRKKNPEKVRNQTRRFYENHRDRIIEKAKKRNGLLTPEAIIWMQTLIDPLCVYCGQLADTIDHLVPIAHGGTGEVANLAPACFSCNRRKGTKTVEEFLATNSKLPQYAGHLLTKVKE